MKIIIVFAMCFNIFACSINSKNNHSLSSLHGNGTVAMSEMQGNDNIIEFLGTVQYVVIEGGFYAIYAEDGRKFMPRHLKKSQEKHGLIVKVKGEILKDVITVQQHGEVLKIIDIEVINDSNVGGRVFK
jgi:hypothetical protein